MVFFFFKLLFTLSTVRSIKKTHHTHAFLNYNKEEYSVLLRSCGDGLTARFSLLANTLHRFIACVQGVIISMRFFVSLLKPVWRRSPRDTLWLRLPLMYFRRARAHFQAFLRSMRRAAYSWQLEEHSMSSGVDSIWICEEVGVFVIFFFFFWLRQIKIPQIPSAWVFSSCLHQEWTNRELMSEATSVLLSVLCLPGSPKNETKK